MKKKIINGELDCGVVVLTDHHQSFDFFTFVNESLRAVVPSTHPLANKDNITLSELQDEAFIMFNQDFELRNIILNACKQVAFSRGLLLKPHSSILSKKWLPPKLG